MADQQPTSKPLCFLIGPIGKDGSVERNHADLLLQTLVKHVLEPEFGYQVKRADEDADPGMIGDRMVTDVINADLVVADLTGLNANAFYELGIRHSTERPTILVAKADTALPFDLVANRTIFVDLTVWASVENARKSLAAAVRAVRAPGHRVSNPITQANASFKMRESADPRDRLFADLQERLSAVETQLSGSARAARAATEARRLSRVRVGPIEKFNAVLDLARRMKAQGAPNDHILRELVMYLQGMDLAIETTQHPPDGWRLEVEGAGSIEVNGDRMRFTDSDLETRPWETFGLS